MSLSVAIVEYQKAVDEFNGIMQQAKNFSEEEKTLKSELMVWESVCDTYRSMEFDEEYSYAFKLKTGQTPRDMLYSAKDITSFYDLLDNLKSATVKLPKKQEYTEIERIEIAERLWQLKQESVSNKGTLQAFSKYPEMIENLKTLENFAWSARTWRDIKPCDDHSRKVKDDAIRQAKMEHIPIRILAIMFVILFPVLCIGGGIGLMFLMGSGFFGGLVMLALITIGIALDIRLAPNIWDAIRYRQERSAKKVYFPVCIAAYDQGIERMHVDNLQYALNILNAVANVYAACQEVYQKLNLCDMHDLNKLKRYKDIIEKGLADTTYEAAKICKSADEKREFAEKFMETCKKSIELQKAFAEQNRRRNDLYNAIIQGSENIEHLKEIEEKKVKELEKLNKQLDDY